MEIPAHPWNHNIHYHRLILDAVPAGAHSALDVGCGNGLLTAELSRTVPDVTGLDADVAVLDNARRHCAQAGCERTSWVHGDVMTHAFDHPFDVVASVATLHHLPDLEAALLRLADLTAPGGVLAVVGLARSRRPADLLFDLAGAVQHRWLVRRHGFWEHTAPMVWPPPHDYATVRRTARRVLTGVRWNRLPLWRYALVWHRPL
ncbi:MULTISPECIES: class I SAM-dependent methyltransferase [Brevibacterium]|uniref:Class I SAM-dependent methyltransferase n=1 Tax=Brevibacterium salitolerans TaxID=1403566 RepID=A0ABN2WYC2_9MICO|nr:class I SAM-dependent methyltransferase [Brevibacterium sp.]